MLLNINSFMNWSKNEKTQIKFINETKFVFLDNFAAHVNRQFFFLKDKI